MLFGAKTSMKVSYSFELVLSRILSRTEYQVQDMAPS